MSQLKLAGNVTTEAEFFERIDSGAPWSIEVLGSKGCLVLRGQGVAVKVTAAHDPLKPGPGGCMIVLEVV